MFFRFGWLLLYFRLAEFCETPNARALDSAAPCIRYAQSMNISTVTTLNPSSKKLYTHLPIYWLFVRCWVWCVSFPQMYGLRMCNVYPCPDTSCERISPSIFRDVTHAEQPYTRGSETKEPVHMHFYIFLKTPAVSWVATPIVRRQHAPPVLNIPLWLINLLFSVPCLRYSA